MWKVLEIGMTPAATRALLLSTAMLTGQLVSGCSAGSGDDAPTENEQAAQVSQNGDVINLRDPRGLFFAEVRASGSGCPRNSVSTRISSDGQVFTTTFSAYETSITPNNVTAYRDCELSIRLRSPQGRAFCVQMFSYGGYASLDRGVRGRQTADYAFEGQPAKTYETKRTDLNGPYDDPFVFHDVVGPREEVWTPCSTQRDLRIRTRLELQNGSPRGNGYMNLAAVDGATRIDVKVANARCGEYEDWGWREIGEDDDHESDEYDDDGADRGRGRSPSGGRGPTITDGVRSGPTINVTRQPIR